MFIFVTYRDMPELSLARVTLSDPDLAVEKTLLVNPDCPVRIMLEYIRKKCRLGNNTQFDLCDEGGTLKGLFNLPTYVYATDAFVHKQTYYIIVMKTDNERRVSTLPQLNHDNRLYPIIKDRVKGFLTGSTDNSSASTAKTLPSPAVKKK